MEMIEYGCYVVFFVIVVYDVLCSFLLYCFYFIDVGFVGMILYCRGIFYLRFYQGFIVGCFDGLWVIRQVVIQESSGVVGFFGNVVNMWFLVEFVVDGNIQVFCFGGEL